MKDFVFCSPTMFVFGHDAEERTGKMAHKFGATKVLLVYGGGSVFRSGLLHRVKQSLDAQKIGYVELGGIQPNPVDARVYEGISLARREGVDFIIAVGGGSAIDTAKAIAIGIPYDGDFWDFFDEKAKVTAAVPVATVLTIPAAGSEGSGDSVITKVSTGDKLGLGSPWMRPKFSIMNPEITFTLPPNQTAYGVTDMMAHILERYFTNTPDVEVTDRMCEGLLMAIMNEAPKVLVNPQDYNARANIMWAGTVAHNGLCGVGREEDWITHCMEHEISAWNDKIAHGAGLAVLFPAWMRYMAEHNPGKLAQLGRRVFGLPEHEDEKTTALRAAECLQKFFVSIGMPKSLREFGLEEKDIDALVKNFHKNNGDVIEDRYCTITPEVTRAIYLEAL